MKLDVPKIDNKGENVAKICNLNPTDPLFRQHNFLWNLVVESSKRLTDFNLNQPTRVALILETNFNGSKMFVYDPFDLLTSHKQTLRPYFENQSWRDPKNLCPSLQSITHVHDYQGHLPIAAHWFIEEPYPTVIKELSIAWGGCLSDFVYGHIPIMDRKTPHHLHRTMSALAPIAVQNCLAAMSKHGALIDSREFVQVMIDINNAKEEGASPEGKVILAQAPDPAPFLSFRKPIAASTKQFTKLLTAARNPRFGLVVEATGIRGFADISQVPSNRIIATFNSLGCTLSIAVKNLNVANVRKEQVYRAVGQPYLEALSKLLTEKFGAANDAIVDSVKNIVEAARLETFGCTIAIFEPLGQPLLGAYFDSQKNAAEVEGLLTNMAHVDGAVHLNSAGNILGFGVLLDGVSAPQLENPSKGARHNSAIRFTAHNHDALVVVVSEDGPITIFHEGKPTKQTLDLPENEKVGPVYGMEEWFKM